MFGSELDQVFVLMVVVWVEEDLLEVLVRVHWLWREGTCLVYSGSDHCDFQELPEVTNSEVADTDAPVRVDALDTAEMRREGFRYVVSPSF